MDEYEQQLSNDNVFVWTGTSLISGARELYCNDWTTREVENGGGVGSPLFWQGGNGQWSQSTFLACNQRHHLYCFEQPWGETYNPMRKDPTKSVEQDFQNVQFPYEFTRLRTPQGVESIQGYKYQSLSSNPNDLYCDAKVSTNQSFALVVNNC